MSLSWRPRSFLTVVGTSEPHTIKEVHGLVDNLGMFGMHYVDALHGYINITELSSGFRIHPAPGFPDLEMAAHFAERVLHLDFNKGHITVEAKKELSDTYNSFLSGACIESYRS